MKQLLPIAILCAFGFCAGIPTLSAQSMDSLILLSSKLPEGPEKCQAQIELASLYQSRGAYQKAISLYEAALNMGLSKGYPVSYPYLYRNLSYCFEAQEDFSGSIEHQMNLLRYYEYHHQMEGTLQCWQRLANLHLWLEQFDEAIQYHQLLLKYYSLKENYREVATINNDLGLIYHRKKEYAQSLEYFKRCEIVLTEHESLLSKKDQSNILLNLGVAYTQTGEMKRAGEILRQAVSLKNEDDDTLGLAKARLYLGAYFFVNNENDEARNQIAESFKVINKISKGPEKEQLLLECYQLLAEIELQEGNIEQYKTLNKRYNEIRERLLSEEQKQRQLLLENQLELETREYQMNVKILEKEKELNASQLDQEKKARALLELEKNYRNLEQAQAMQSIQLENQRLEKQRFEQILMITRQKATSDEQQQRIRLLEKDNQLNALNLQQEQDKVKILELNSRNQNVELQNERTRRNLNIAISIFLGLIGVFMVIFFLQNRKQNKFLALKNDRLQNAHRIIDNQKNELLTQNDKLEVAVNERTKEIVDANKVLAEKNTQLEQFAYIISHNLRAPIARIHGLTAILNSNTLNAEEKTDILQKIVLTSGELDAIIKDLHGIIEIGNNATLLTPLKLEEVLANALKLLKIEIEQSQAQLDVDFSEALSIRGIPSYMESILFNLIGNAIKYRAIDRPCKIEIKSTKDPNGGTILMVKDNGIGINLTKYGDKIFGLYKRFHLDREGKGMGLYLVKTQVQSMRGNIQVNSKVNEGSSFRIWFPEV